MGYKKIKTKQWHRYGVLLLCCSWAVGTVEAQVDSNRIERHALTYKLVLTDYNSLDPIYQAANPGRLLHFDDINYAAELGYHYRLKPSLQLGAVLRIGSMDAHHSIYDEQDSLCQPCAKRRRDELFIGLDLLGQYHFTNGYLLPKRYWLAPYVLLGIGTVHMDERQEQWDVQVPMGIGINGHFTPRLAFQIQAEYRFSLGIQKHSLVFSAGIFWQLGRSVPTE